MCVCLRVRGGGGGEDCEAQRLPPLPSGRQTETSRPLTKQSSDNGEALAILVLIQRSTWRFGIKIGSAPSRAHKNFLRKCAARSFLLLLLTLLTARFVAQFQCSSFIYCMQGPLHSKVVTE